MLASPWPGPYRPGQPGGIATTFAEGDCGFPCALHVWARDTCKNPATVQQFMGFMAEYSPTPTSSSSVLFRRAPLGHLKQATAAVRRVRPEAVGLRRSPWPGWAPSRGVSRGGGCCRDAATPLPGKGEGHSRATGDVAVRGREDASVARAAWSNVSDGSRVCPLMQVSNRFLRDDPGWPTTRASRCIPSEISPILYLLMPP
jgi:hypothetical protein